MIKVQVAEIPAVVEPSAAASAAVALAGRKGAALGTRARGNSSRRSACRGGFCGCAGIDEMYIYLVTFHVLT